jgi:hypothetical protein
MSSVAAGLSVEEAEAFRAKCREFLNANATGIKLTEPDPRDDLTVAASRVPSKTG